MRSAAVPGARPGADHHDAGVGRLDVRREGTGGGIFGEGW